MQLIIIAVLAIVAAASAFMPSRAIKCPTRSMVRYVTQRVIHN